MPSGKDLAEAHLQVLQRMHSRATEIMRTAARGGDITVSAIHREEVDALDAILAALRARPEARAGDGTGWLYDISAAPNDQTTVLLTAPSLIAGRPPIVGEAYFEPGADDGSWWWAGEGHGCHGAYPILNPIAWREMPEPAPVLTAQPNTEGRDA